MARYWGFEKPGCPLCRCAHQAERRQLNWFLLEHYYSLPMLLRLESDRFCERHALLLLDGRNAHLSGTFQFLAQGEVRRLRGFRESLPQERRSVLPWRRGPRKLPEGARPAGEPEGCPSCAAGQGAVAVEVVKLLQALATEQGRADYREHDGLCRPHLWLALREAPPGTAAWLAEETERRLQALGQAFELYFHRLDYRFQHEPRGKEQTAWRRGLRFFWGEVAGGERSPVPSEQAEVGD